MNKTVNDSVNLIRPFAKQKALFYFAGLMFAGSTLANQHPQSNNKLFFEGTGCSISAIQNKQKKYRKKTRQTEFFSSKPVNIKSKLISTTNITNTNLN